MHFSWVVEFPMFARDEETGGWAAMHHPFTGPRPQDRHLLTTDPGAVRAQAYDLVLNGSEAGGGTIRIHDQVLQQQVFDLLGIDQEQAREQNHLPPELPAELLPEARQPLHDPRQRDLRVRPIHPAEVRLVAGVQ